MTITEDIQQYLQRLPDTMQQEVLDFVRYLLYKQEREFQKQDQQDEQDWSTLSLNLAMRGMEEEETPVYSTDDLKEVFS